MLALTELDLGEATDMAEYQPRPMLDWLAVGKTSGLQNLAMDVLPAEQLHSLTMLTALTAVYVRIWYLPADLGVVCEHDGPEELAPRDRPSRGG